MISDKICRIRVNDVAMSKGYLRLSPTIHTLENVRLSTTNPHFHFLLIRSTRTQCASLRPFVWIKLYGAIFVRRKKELSRMHTIRVPIYTPIYYIIETNLRLLSAGTTLKYD